MKPFHVETNALGVTRRFFSDGEGNITVEFEQDLTPLLERNKAAANDRGKSITSEVANPIASIPPIFYVKWLNEEGFDIFEADRCDFASKRLRQKLNDPDWRFLRTSELTL